MLNEPQAIEFIEVPALNYERGFVTPFSLDVYMDIVLMPALFFNNVDDPFVLTAIGDSMAPVIQEGNTIIVDRGKTPQSNDLISCVLNGQHLLRQICYKNYCTLLFALNANFDVQMIMPKDDFVILGKVVKIITVKTV